MKKQTNRQTFIIITFFTAYVRKSVPVSVHQKFMTRFLISRQGLSKLLDLKQKRSHTNQKKNNKRLQDKWKRKWYWGNFSSVNSSTCVTWYVYTHVCRHTWYNLQSRWKLLRGLINFFLCEFVFFLFLIVSHSFSCIYTKKVLVS